MRLRPNDRVILGSGSGRWSPTDEFTEALVEAVEASHPEIVRVAREWRIALCKLRDAKGLTTAQLRGALEAVGVARELQTLDGWLELTRASPIAPRGVKTLTSLGPLFERYAESSVNEIADACFRLRRLRLTSGRALLQAWQGSQSEAGSDEAWIGDLLTRLRGEVQVYEIEGVTLGDVPTGMLGWWVPTQLIGQFESPTSKVA